MSISPLSQPGNNAIQPDAPSIGAATATAGGGATVAFTASSNPGKGSANYIATSSPGGITASAASSPITFANGTLVAATSYTFTVTKESGSGVSSVSSSATSAITAFYVPAAPTITSSSAGDGFLDISFTAGSANGSAITNYQYSLNGGSTWTALSPADNTSPVRIPSLSNGTNYTVLLRAVNAAGAGAQSNSFNDTSTLTTQPFGAPFSAVATLTDGCNTATWAFSANANGRPITAYTYQLSTNGGATWGVETPGSSYSLDTSKSSSATVVRIKAANAAGYGSYGAASSANATRSAGTAVTQYSGSSCNRQSRQATPYSRTGCPAVEPTNYTYVPAVGYASDPDCTDTGDTTCWNSPTYAVVSSRYENSCSSRVRYDTTRTTWTPKAGNTCATRTSDSEGGPIADPDCGALPSGYSSNSCWTVQAYGVGEYVTLGSQRWQFSVDNYFFPTEYFAFKVDGSNNYQECCIDGCACGEFYIQCKSYWVYKCGDTYSANFRGCQS